MLSKIVCAKKNNNNNKKPTFLEVSSVEVLKNAINKKIIIITLLIIMIIIMSKKTTFKKTAYMNELVCQYRTCTCSYTGRRYTSQSSSELGEERTEKSQLSRVLIKHRYAQSVTQTLDIIHSLSTSVPRDTLPLFPHVHTAKPHCCILWSSVYDPCLPLDYLVSGFTLDIITLCMSPASHIITLYYVHFLDSLWHWHSGIKCCFALLYS